MGDQIGNRFMLFNVVILVLISVTSARYHVTDIQYIPANARPGHVVTLLHNNTGQISKLENTVIVMNNGEQIRNVPSSHKRPRTTLSTCFVIMDNGALITTSDISHLVGNTISLTVHHQVEDNKWFQKLLLQVEARPRGIQFQHLPYIGHVRENLPPGAKVLGLDISISSLKYLFYNCNYNIVSGSKDVFDIELPNKFGNLLIVSTKMLDREQKSGYHILIQAVCFNEYSFALVKIEVDDENDNKPEFDSDSYSGELRLDQINNLHTIVTVHATDVDENDAITYQLKDSNIFDIDPVQGHIYIKHSSEVESRKYLVEVIALDSSGHMSNPLIVTINVLSPAISPYSRDLRVRRSTLEPRSFVVRRNDTDELFTVASVPTVEGEMFYFHDPEPDGLSLDENTGMVIKDEGYEWNETTTQIDFMVNITKNDDPDYPKDLEVTMHLVDRGHYSELFEDEPVPLWTVVPEWIRPETTIFTVHSTDKAEYGTEVRYTLESGGEERFEVDMHTGELLIAGREQFQTDKVFELAISAKNLGAANKTQTAAQLFRIKVDSKSPQFWEETFREGMLEETGVGDEVVQIRAKSFYGLDITYSMVEEDTTETGVFSLDSNTGSVTLLKELEFIRDTQQYRYDLTATESDSDFVTTTKLIITVEPVNRHTPVFPAAPYIALDVEEGADNIDKYILTVSVSDVDPYELGNIVNFTCDDEHFVIEKTGRQTADIRNVLELDYDEWPDHHYEFTVWAVDGGDPPLTGSTTVQVWLTNINDNAPVLTPEIQAVQVKDDTTPTKLLHVVQAYDLDGDVIEFTGINVPNIIEFTSEGRLRLTGQINGHEDIEFDFRAVDDGSCCGSGTTHTTDGKILIQFVGVNHPPRFEECNTYNPSIAEHTEENTHILSISARDDDAGANGELTFSVIVQHAEERHFDLEQEAGQKNATLYNVNVFDRENPHKEAVKVEGEIHYKVTVLAQDHGNPPLKTTCFFLVKIDDINDQYPLFDEATYKINIHKTTGIDTNVTRVFAVDDDAEGENSQVAYTIVNDTDCPGCFRIDQHSGFISIAASIDDSIDSVKLNVTANDKGTPVRESDVLVEISLVADFAQLPPQWEQVLVPGISPPEYKYIDDHVAEFDENVNPGYLLVEEFIAKPQSTAVVIYYVPKGRSIKENQRQDFVREASDGSLYLMVMRSDYEDNHEYIIKMRASNNDNGFFSDTRLQVHLIDVNDMIPQFQGLDESGKYPAAVSQQTEIGDTVLYVYALDLDGTPPNNVVSYEWSPGCGGDCDAFNINRDTGEISAAITFDREIQPSYHLRVRAVDGADSAITPGAPNSADGDVTVEVMGASMNPPYLEDRHKSFNIQEDLPFGHVVTTWEAVDPDPAVNVKYYTISTGNDARKFSVDNSTGVITVTGELSHMRQQWYNMTYQVFDGSVSNTSNLYIEIASLNMYPPVFEPLDYNVTHIVEHEDPGNDAIVQVTATDPDSTRPGDIRYSLAGNFYEQNRDAFDIDETTGAVYLRHGLDRDYPDGHDNWLINVVARDETGSGGKDGYGILNLRLLDVNDNDPKFDLCCLEGGVDEDAIPGAVVMELLATDVDTGENGTVEYTLIWSPDDGTGTDIFDLTNNQIRINTGVPFNRTAQNWYHVRVRANDMGSPPRETGDQAIWIEILDVNDNPPEFTEQTVSFDMPEELPTGSYVAELSAMDADERENAERNYRITGGDDDENFYIDSIIPAGTGVIKIKKIVDYEVDPQQYTLTVEVRHPTKDAHIDTTTVTIQVTDINDNSPEFTPEEKNVTQSEDIAVGTTITTMTATDADEGLNGQFEYTIDYPNSDPQKQFRVGSQSGEVTVRSPLDRETLDIHVLHVLAIDKGEPPMTGTGTVRVTLTDVNDNAPDFKETYKPIVWKDTAKGDLIQELRIVDPDTPVNGPPFTVQMDCSNGGDCNHFTLEEISDGENTDGEGIYNLRSNEDGFSREQLGTKFLEIPLLMEDAGSPSQSATRILHVLIASYNDNVPAPGHKDVVVYNYKAEFPDTWLGNVFVDEEDDWDLGDKTFEFVTDQDDFSLTADIGDLFMKAGAPSGDHNIQVRVTDSFHGAEAISTVRVHIIYLKEDAVYSSGSMRLNDITAEEFIFKETDKQSKYELLRSSLASQFQADESNVHIFTVRDADGEDRKTDIMFAVDGPPWSRPARLNGIVWTNKQEIESDVGIQIEMSPIDTCMFEECLEAGCDNNFTVTGAPLTLNTNKTCVVGLDASYIALCRCGLRTFQSGSLKCGPNACLNNGTCHETWSNYYCDCPDGFDGPRCQQTKHSFDGQGWAWYEPLSQCENDKLSFEFATQASDGLLLYNGPMYDNGDPQDYISVELIAGYPKVRVDLGEGELTLTIDGKNADGDQTLNPLTDGRWHSIEIFQSTQTFQVIVDRCSVAEITENISMSIEDRSACEAIGDVPGESFLLNVFTPLELGGRSHPSVNYPSGLLTDYQGCIKNLVHNGMIYDLNIGEKGEQEHAEDGCPDEVGCEDCPGNSTCVGSLLATVTGTCVCLPGFGGSECDERRQAIDFEQSDSFIHWDLKPALNDSGNFQHDELQVMFRTRTETGSIFDASSFSTLERMKLEVVDKILHFRYDLGSGDRVISLPDVDVSDGLWHTVLIQRSGNHAILRLDSGEGKFYGESIPTDDHRLIKLGSHDATDSVYGAADVRIQKYSNQPIVSNVLIDSCVNDIRYMNQWFPLHEGETSEAANLVQTQNTQPGCESDACEGVTCPPGQYCEDMWRVHECSCPVNETKPEENPSICVSITDCSYNPCVHGDCVMTEGGRRCNCYEGYEGEFCDEETGTALAATATLSNEAIISIVTCLVVFLLILLVFMILSSQKKSDGLLDEEEEDDIQEDVLYYNDEGAGEEDELGFDLSRMLKPIGAGGEGEGAIIGAYGDVSDEAAIGAYGEEHARAYAELDRMEPEPMHEGRVWPLPGDYADVGSFIVARMVVADEDTDVLPFDSIREYEYEGSGSSAGTISSILTSSSGDQDFDYLVNYGPRFKKLADLYGEDNDDGDESSV